MAETEAFAGVVVFGNSREDLKVVDWACEHLSVRAGYRLCIIRVYDTNSPPSQPRRYNKYDDVEGMLEKAGYRESDIMDFQNRINKVEERPKHKADVKKHIWCMEFRGENFERTLQGAINKLRPEGLDILVLRWSEPDDPQRTPVNTLEPKGCSILLADVDPSTTSRKVLTLATVGPSFPGEGSAPPTPAGAGAATPAPPMEAAGSATTTARALPAKKGEGSSSAEPKKKDPERGTGSDDGTAVTTAP